MSSAPSTDKKTALPLVSIGVPVYNGARMLPRALDSLLAQDYPSLEFVIADNDSTDATAEICQEYVRRDPRFRYHRNATNIGAVKNFNLAFELSRGDFFTWAAHDDVRAPQYISRCVAAFGGRPDVVLVHSGTEFIDDEGRVTEEASHNPLSGDDPVRKRFHAAILDPWWGLAVYGLIRSSAMRQTGLVRDMLGGDKVFLAELSMLGNVLEVPGLLWQYHFKPFDGSYLRSLKRALLVQNRASAEFFPHINLLARYLGLASRAPCSPQERVLLTSDILQWYFINLKVWPLLQSARSLVPPDQLRLLQGFLESSALYRRLRHLPG